MSNVGPSPTLPSDTSEITSHTATHQWQSFEFRMRHRRAERCLLRAEMALDAGVEDDAREALDEAERLHSENPKLAALQAILADRAAASVVAYQAAQHASSRGRMVRVAAAALIFLLVGAGAYLGTRTDAPDVRTAPAAVPNATELAGSNSPAPLSLPAAPAVNETSLSASTPTATAGRVEAPQPDSAVDATIRVPDTASANTSARPSDTKSKPALPAFNPQFAEPRPVTLPSPSSSADAVPLRTAAAPAVPEPAPVIPETPGAAPGTTLDRMGEKLPAANMPATERRAAPEKPAVADNVPAAPVVPVVPVVNEEPRVRAVLARYEAAYSGLNAAAAQQVWPGVDERSLARAFDTLQSQQVSLGQCAVQVAGTTASASCNGRITWTPKVGGGSQSTARQWRFELHSGNGVWQITRAEVR
ncbi:MAG: hypothetical protein H0W53_05995 [Acidobacteria bacterium]|nr:hypothetical protein [Acidobacteriota bacterium]